MRNLVTNGRRAGLDVEALCRRGGCQVSVEKLRAAEGGLQGLLIPGRPGRFKMIVDGDPPGGLGAVRPQLRRPLARHRRRFVMAHELAHTFFFSWCGPRAYQHVPPDQEQEQFCDQFARTLLVPPRLIASYDPTPESVISIQERFDVSMEVAARALAGSHGPRFFVSLLLSQHDHPDLARPQWRDPDNNPRAPWWTGSLVERALEEGRARGGLAWSNGKSGQAEVLHLPARSQLILIARRPD